MQKYFKAIRDGQTVCIFSKTYTKEGKEVSGIALDESQCEIIEIDQEEYSTSIDDFANDKEDAFDKQSELNKEHVARLKKAKRKDVKDE